MGSVAYNHPIGSIYRLGLPGIYCQLGDYMLPIPPFTFEPEKSVVHFSHAIYSPFRKLRVGRLDREHVMLGSDEKSVEAML